MKRILLTLSLCLFSVAAKTQSPQERGLNTINRSSAEAVVRFLASDELEGREAGCRGARVAAEYIASQLAWMGIKPMGDSYMHPFEACRKERGQRGRFEVHPDSVAKLKEGVHRKLSLCNVLGMIPGRNGDEYVIVGAHFDHLGIDPALAGDKIYNGADDNASGVSAVLQIARAFVGSEAVPERNIIFAFWDGEEIGLLGSRAFVQSCGIIPQIKGYLNFDMIGRNNMKERPEHVVYFYTASHPAFERWLREDIERYGLGLDPHYNAWDKPLSGSDNAPFAAAGVPIIWYHTDGHPDYHQPSDHADRLNWDKLVDITRASFLNAWNLANDKEY